MRRLAVALATLVAIVAAFSVPALASAPATTTYRPPVDAPIIDPFRPPAENWNAGNRGLEYATPPGTSVGASADGEVVFADLVAGGRHVVVLHADGLRTSYSFLATVAVRRGDVVRQGQTLGTTLERFHFGARAGDAYLDPARLFGGGPPEVHLVPEELRRPLSEAGERAGLVRMFSGWMTRAITAGESAVEWARDHVIEEIEGQLDELKGMVLYAYEAQSLTHVVRFAVALRDWRKSLEDCTPVTVPAPVTSERRIVVLVAGLGSNSSRDSIDMVDTAALGYDRADVVRYSYRGGTAEEHSYDAADTSVDIHRSAGHLRELLERVAADNPGVPIDIIAHSQGGIVARTALTDEVDGADPRLPAVKTLVTLSSPHRGAALATLATMVGHTVPGELVEAGMHEALPDFVDPRATSVTQLAEYSSFMRQLNARPLPVGLNATSIGAREDWIVPAGMTRLQGANNVIVSAPGHRTEHSDMPSAPETQREIALAVAGMEPTCQEFADFVGDAVVSDSIRSLENSAGLALWMVGTRIDHGLDALTPTIPRRAD